MGFVGSIRGRVRSALGRTLLSGTEGPSVEITGWLDVGRAREIAGPGLSVREGARGAEIEILAFRMSGLALDGAPWTGMDYGEILFRLGVDWRGSPAWLAVGCALDRAPVAALAAALIRYPVTRVHRIGLQPGVPTWHLEAEDRGATVLRATLEPTGEQAPPAEVRPVLVRSRDRLLRIPWDETPPPARSRAHVTVEVGELEREALGLPAHWETAVVHEGRIHHCGLAWPV